MGDEGSGSRTQSCQHMSKSSELADVLAVLVDRQLNVSLLDQTLTATKLLPVEAHQHSFWICQAPCSAPALRKGGESTPYQRSPSRRSGQSGSVWWRPGTERQSSPPSSVMVGSRYCGGCSLAHLATTCVRILGKWSAGISGSGPRRISQRSATTLVATL